MASLYSSSRARAVALICLALAFCAMAAHLTRGDNAGAAPVSPAAADTLGIDPAANDVHEAPESTPLVMEPDDDAPAEAPLDKAADSAKEDRPESKDAQDHPKEDEAAKEERPADQEAQDPPKEDEDEDEDEEFPIDQEVQDPTEEEEAAKEEHSESKDAQDQPKEAETAKDDRPIQDHPKEEKEAAKEESPAAADSLKIIEAPVKDGKPAFLMEDHALPIISLQFSFPGGGYAHEPEKYAGAASLAVSALDEGAGKYSPSDFKRLLQRLHTEVNFSVDEDGLYITLTTLTSGLDKSAEIIADLLAAPAYEKADLPRHVGAVLTAIKERDSDPASAGMAELKKHVWGAHPYARDALGTAESVKRVTSNLLQSYHQEAVNASVMRVAAAGDLTAETLSALTERFGEKLRAKAAKPSAGAAFLTADLPEAVYRQEAYERLHIERDIPQTIVLFALPGVTRNDPAFFNYYVANYLLGGGGFESRLMHKLREEKAYAYSVNTGLAYGVKGGMLAGSAGVSSANADAFLTELKAILDSGESYKQEEISAAKSHMERAFALSLSNNAAQAGMLAGLQLYGFGPDYIAMRLKKLAEVTPESLAGVLNATWRGDKMIAVTVGRSGTRAESAEKPTESKPSGDPAATPPAATAATPPPAKHEGGHGGKRHKRGGHGGH